jgi:Ca-activated chloride channel family protein
MKTRIILGALLILSSCSHTVIGQVEYPGEDRTGSPYFFIPSEDPETERLPLKSTTVDVNIAGVIADVSVTQEYRNEGLKPIEAIYVFPASTRAAVYSMVMTIGERLIVAKIEEKNKARQQYEEAKDNGQSVSLLEQERPNVFTMNVANIMPGDVIRVELKYTEILVPEDRVYRFIYPTVVGPRYNNGNEEIASVNNGWNENPYTLQGFKPLQGLHLTLSLSTAIPIKDLRCPSHKTDIAYTGKFEATVKLSEEELHGGNRDFILEYRLAGQQIETGVLLYQGDRENFFLAMIQPPDRIAPEQLPPREYVFIVDVSGSMHGFPIDISKKLMRDLLGNLRPTDKFNVILFAGGSSVFSESSVPATPDNIRSGISFIDREQGGGGTELLPALHKALSLRGAENYSRTFIIATDGYVTIEKEAFDLVRRSLGRANFFAFGIGTSVNRYLIEGLAHAGQGEAFVITEEAMAPATADKFRKYISSPVMTEVEVSFSGFDTYDLAQESYPDLFAERPVVIFGKYRGNWQGSVVVTGRSGNQNIREQIDLAAVSPEAGNSAIRYLWARERIRTLDDYAGIGYGTKDSELEVTKLGLEYNLLTSYTSFIAIDTEVRNQQGGVTTIRQPLPLPEGVSNYAVGGVMASKSMNKRTGASKDAVMEYQVEPGIAAEDAFTVFACAESMPEFPGGECAMKKYLKDHLIYPDPAIAHWIDGTVYVCFIVDKDGSVRDVAVLRGIGEAYDKEAIRVIQAMPKWKPGLQNGMPVAVRMTLPVKFGR